MSAEPRQTTLDDAWTKWQGQVVQGRFVLRRCLGWSDHGAVFLTEHKAKNLAEAAIKFVRADAPQAEPLLVRWQAAVNLSHPHLVQLFEVGRWQIEQQDYLFVVMEYGDQTLAEILRRRPLSAEELQELLPPVLDALTFLHRRQLVHSRLQPSNFLAVGDQLKLASDTIRPAGQDHGMPGDVWNLGATLVEAITARARLPVDQPFDEASLPAGLPATLLETVRRCLSPSPTDRPTIIELRSEYKLAPVAKPEPQVSQVAASAPRVAAAPQPVPSPPPQTPSRVAALTDSVPIVPRQVAPLQPIQTASRVTVSFHAVPSNSPAAAQAQPAPSVSPVVAPPKPAPHDVARPASGDAASPAALSSSPMPSAPRQVVLPPNVASRVAVSSHLAPSAPREVTPPRPAAIASQAAPSQPAPSAPREVAPPQPANIAPQAAAPSQSVPSAPREVTPPQVVNIAPPVAVASARPVPNAPPEVIPPQPANIAPRVVPPAQPAPTTARELTPPQAANIAPQAAAPSQSAPSAPREVAPPQAANIAPRVVPPAQPAPGAPREVAPFHAADIAARIAAVAPPAPGSKKAGAPSQEAAPAEGAPKRHILGIAAGVLLLAAAVWIGLRSTNDSPAPLEPAAIPAPPVIQPAPEEKVAESKQALTVPVSPPPQQPAPPAQPTAAEQTSSGVLNQVLPAVPKEIRSKIQGRLYVTVRALVDPAGNVMAVLMENPGSSKYFARLSENAAREWQFAPADTEEARVWLLRFEYTRDSAAVRISEQ